MVKEYARPASIEDALEIYKTVPGSVLLAGGTFVLAGYSFGSHIVRDPVSFLPKGDSRAALSPRKLPESVIDISRLLPSRAERKGSTLTIGAGCTFQNLADSSDVPSIFKHAALSMANRNVRNRATVGGNIAANKSCASLVPLFLAFDAEVEFAVRGKKVSRLPLAQWLGRPEGILLSVSVKIADGLFGSGKRHRRTACDIATATAAAVFTRDGNILRNVRIAMGGFGPVSRRYPELEAELEGKIPGTQAEIETLASRFLSAITDQRGSAEYKIKCGSVLLADALLEAEVIK